MPQRPSMPQLYGRIGGLRLRATHDPHEYTAAGRRAFLDRFEREVDPGGNLPPAERAARAEAARKAYFTKLAFRSAVARRRKSRNRTSAPTEPAEPGVVRAELRDEAAAAPSEPTR